MATVERIGQSAHMECMGKVTTTTTTATKKIRGRTPLVYRGVVIQRPAIAPNTPLARIRRGARIAVQQYAHELAAAK